MILFRLPMKEPRPLYRPDTYFNDGNSPIQGYRIGCKKCDSCKPGWHKIEAYLYYDIFSKYDFHFSTQDSDGNWSEKHGKGDVNPMKRGKPTGLGSYYSVGCWCVNTPPRTGQAQIGDRTREPARGNSGTLPPRRR